MRILNLLLIVFLFSILTNCSGKCTYKVFDEVQNSQKSLTIVKYFSWCGFTSSNNLNLSVLRKNDELTNAARVVFVAVSKVQDKLDRDTTIKYSWINDTTVLITHSRDLQVFRKELR